MDLGARTWNLEPDSSTTRDSYSLGSAPMLSQGLVASEGSTWRDGSPTGLVTAYYAPKLGGWEFGTLNTCLRLGATGGCVPPDAGYHVPRQLKRQARPGPSPRFNHPPEHQCTSAPPISYFTTMTTVVLLRVPPHSHAAIQPCNQEITHLSFRDTDILNVSTQGFHCRTALWVTASPLLSMATRTMVHRQSIRDPCPQHLSHLIPPSNSKSFSEFRSDASDSTPPS